MTAMTINMSRHALPHVHHQCGHIKIYPTGKGTLPSFIIPYTYIKSTAKLLLLIIAVIDFAKEVLSDKIKKWTGKQNSVKETHRMKFAQQRI